MRHTLDNTAKTLYLPITTAAETLYKHKRITAFVLFTMIILSLCIKYVPTKPMAYLRNGISKAYHETAHFLKNPVHAGLMGGICGAIYLLIGRELLNKDLKRKAIMETIAKKEKEFKEYLANNACFTIHEAVHNNKVSWDLTLNKDTGTNTIVGDSSSRVKLEKRKRFGVNWHPSTLTSQ